MKLLSSIFCLIGLTFGLVNSGFIYSFNNLPSLPYYGASYAFRHAYISQPSFIIPSTYLPSFNFATILFQGKHHHPDHHGDGTDGNDKKEVPEKQQQWLESTTVTPLLPAKNAEEQPEIMKIEKSENLPTESAITVPQLINSPDKIALSNSIVYTVPQPLSWPMATQFHQQDGLGQYYYGYANPHSAKQEIKSIDGITRGAYSYIDANNQIQTVQYVSDDINGFRVAATNLPKSPEPIEIPDSPDIALAKLEHFRAHKEAIDRLNAANANVVAENSSSTDE